MTRSTEAVLEIVMEQFITALSFWFMKSSFIFSFLKGKERLHFWDKLWKILISNSFIFLPIHFLFMGTKSFSLYKQKFFLW